MLLSLSYIDWTVSGPWVLWETDKINFLNSNPPCLGVKNADSSVIFLSISNLTPQMSLSRRCTNLIKLDILTQNGMVHCQLDQSLDLATRFLSPVDQTDWMLENTPGLNIGCTCLLILPLSQITPGHSKNNWGAKQPHKISVAVGLNRAFKSWMDLWVLRLLAFHLTHPRILNLNSGSWCRAQYPCGVIFVSSTTLKLSRLSVCLRHHHTRPQDQWELLMVFFVESMHTQGGFPA